MIPRQTGSQSVSLFCVAALTDIAELTKWETHLLPLQQAGLLTFWSERHMPVGANRMAELIRHLDQADGVVFLLSADFFADNNCVVLMHNALLRQQKDHIQLIPLLVRSVTWQDSPIGTFSCLPANGVPITMWEHPDEGWFNTVQAVCRRFNRAILPSLSQRPLDKRATTDRERMLRLLHRTYQASLDGSLQGIAWMELGLAEHPDAVRNATHLLQRLPDRTEHMLPAGTSILSAYDQAGEQLLVLGAPGAGKSTLLLDLAQCLIERTEADVTHPLPMIVPLSSWAEHRPPLPSGW